MDPILLTVFIPSYNRSERLEIALKWLISEIVDLNLASKIAVLVGDNGSVDQTPDICQKALELARSKGVTFDYFRNETNLGFSGNIEAGCIRVNSNWMMLVSDDDTLCHGSLGVVCSDLEEYKPSIAIYNFAQPPYSFSNPLIKETILIRRELDYSDLSTIVSWPKMTGVTFEVPYLKGNPEKIHKICKISNHFPQVTIAMAISQTANVLLKSSTFIGQPDDDYLDHVNFVPYIGEYLIKEMKDFQFAFDSDSNSLRQLSLEIPRTNILDSSVSVLISFYRGKTKLTVRVKRRMINNLVRYLWRNKTTYDGLVLDKPKRLFWLKCCLLVLLMTKHALLLRLTGERLQLMPDAF